MGRRARRYLTTRPGGDQTRRGPDTSEAAADGGEFRISAPVARPRPDGLGTKGGVVRAEGINGFLCTRLDGAPDLCIRNALIVRSAARGPPPSTRHRARPSEASVAWSPVGRGTGPSSGAQDAKAGAGRSAGPRSRPSMGEPDPPWGHLAPRFSARSVEPHALGAKPRPTSGRSGRARAHIGERPGGNRPWGNRSVHRIPRGRSCSPSTQEPPVAQPGALNARLGMGGHR